MRLKTALVIGLGVVHVRDSNGAGGGNGAVRDKLGSYVDSCFKDPSKCCLPEEDRVALPKCQPSEDGTYPCAIKVATGGWTAAFANTYVGKIFWEEILGYPVEIEADFDSFTGTTSESDVLDSDGKVVSPSQWRVISTEVKDVNLEVWVYSQKVKWFEHVIEKGDIIDAGALGPIGKIGWFMPAYMLDRDLYYSFWGTYRDPEKLKNFEDPQAERPCCPSDVYAETRDIFPCMPREDFLGTPVEHGGYANGKTCDDNPDLKIPTYGGRFLAGAQDWSQADDQIIKNLNLNMTTQFAAAESNLIRQIGESIAAEEPLLFYMWKPHGVFGKYNLTSVLLPPYNDECYAKRATGGVDCDYPMEVIYKIYRKDWGEKYADAAYFVEVFQYETTAQQEEMLNRIMQKPEENLHQHACAWIKNNPTTWNRWVKLVNDRFNIEEDLQQAGSIKAFSYTLALINITIALGFLSWTLLNQQHIVVKASQTRFLAMISIGAIVSSSTIFPVTIDDSNDTFGLARTGEYTPANTACQMSVWLYTMGFQLTFAPLFAKMWRMNVLFASNKTLKKTQISNKLLFGIIFALAGIDATIVAIWQVTDPLLYYRRVAQKDTYGNILKSVGKCESEKSSVFLGLVFVFHLLVLLYGNYLCYKARDISTAFSEGKYVAVAMVSNFQVLALAAPVLVIVAENPTSSMFIRSGVIFLNDLTAQMFIFLPKIMMKRRGVNSFHSALHGDGGSTSSKVVPTGKLATETTLTPSSLKTSHDETRE
mmetsp:Transcript_4354/g.7429  ORF Transcript_4354/g.7429 Transcript_4354/m.7429 type:complete len:762 (-) Transcript_4354:27-2312(-)